MEKQTNVLFEVVSYKTDIKGFWKDKKGKVYVDNINIIKAYNGIQFELKLIEMFNKGEECVFVIGTNEAYILYPNNTKDVLKHRILLKEKHLKASYVKELLKIHNGLTVYREADSYTIEIWK